VGDSLTDLQSAAAVGALPILVRTGKGQIAHQALTDAQAHNELTHALVYDDLATFTNALLSGSLDPDMQACRQASGAG
jgi:phosphoglycolate phosphatase-like HAD superfamily hydrolase